MLIAYSLDRFSQNLGLRAGFVETECLECNALWFDLVSWVE